MASSSSDKRDWMATIMAANGPEPTERHQQCDTHGPFASRMIRPRIWSKCPACNDEAQAQLEAEAAREATAREDQRRTRLLRVSGLRGRYLSTIFGNYEAATQRQRAALQVVREFVDSLTPTSAATLFLLGTPGTGKTHLAAAAVSALIAQRGISAELITASALVREIRATWRPQHTDSATEDDVIHRLGNVGLLALDDVGATFCTEGEQKHLLDVIDERYTLGRPTIVCSNLAAPKLKESIGARAFDRLRENSQVLVLDWPSHRGRA